MSLKIALTLGPQLVTLKKEKVLFLIYLLALLQRIYSFGSNPPSTVSSYDAFNYLRTVVVLSFVYGLYHSARLSRPELYMLVVCRCLLTVNTLLSCREPGSVVIVIWLILVEL